MKIRRPPPRFDPRRRARSAWSRRSTSTPASRPAAPPCCRGSRTSLGGAAGGKVGKDAKTRLQEWLQARQRPLPVYELVPKRGDDHAKIFHVGCTLVEPDADRRRRGQLAPRAEQAAAAAPCWKNWTSPSEHAHHPAGIGHRSGSVAVIGRPNVGKSTLVNALVGAKVSIVSNRPQTTRHRLLGIATFPEGQMLLVDTPGMHQRAGKSRRRR